MITLPQLRAVRGKLAVPHLTNWNEFYTATSSSARGRFSETNTAAYRRLIFRWQACFEQMDSKTYFNYSRVFYDNSFLGARTLVATVALAGKTFASLFVALTVFVIVRIVLVAAVLV